MALLAYNKTTSALALAAGSPIVTLPASSATGARGPAVDVTSELRGLSSANYTSLDAQRSAGSVDFEWSGAVEYKTAPLLVGTSQVQNTGTFTLYFAPAGSDTNAGTVAQPLATLWEGLKRLSPVWDKQPVFKFAKGTHVWPGKGVNSIKRKDGETFNSVGMVNNTNGYPDQLAAIGGYDPVFTTSLSTTASIVAGASAGNMRVTGLSSSAGLLSVTINGAASPFNNGTFAVSSIFDGTTVDVVNADATIPDANSGAITVTTSVDLTVTLAGVLNILGGVKTFFDIDVAPLATTPFIADDPRLFGAVCRTLQGTSTIDRVFIVSNDAESSGIVRVYLGRNSNAMSPTGNANSIGSGAPAGQMRITGNFNTSGLVPGNFLHVTGAASATNNGKFTVTTVVNSFTADVTNASAVIPDANNGKILVCRRGPDTVRIERPNVTINYANFSIGGLGGGSGILFDGFKLKATQAGTTTFFDTGLFQFAGCEIDLSGTTTISPHLSQIELGPFLGPNSGFSLVSGLNFTGAWIHDGNILVGQSQTNYLGRLVTFNGMALFSNIGSFSVGKGSFLDCSGAYFKACRIIGFAGSTVAISQNLSEFNQCDIRLALGSNGFFSNAFVKNTSASVRAFLLAATGSPFTCGIANQNGLRDTGNNLQPVGVKILQGSSGNILGFENGTSGSLIAGAAAGKMRLTGLTNMTRFNGANVFITISGSVNPVNNGTFRIVNFVSDTTVDLQYALGVVPDAGPLTWKTQNFTNIVGVSGAVAVGDDIKAYSDLEANTPRGWTEVYTAGPQSGLPTGNMVSRTTDDGNF